MKKYKNKLKYRSWHRGTKEADLFLGRFFDRYASKMSDKELVLYEKFLNLIDDNDLLYIVKGEKKWDTAFPTKIVSLLEEFIKSENIQESPINTTDANINIEEKTKDIQTKTFNTENYVKKYLSKELGFRFFK